MSNFTPIPNGAAANASTVNSPLYELDSAITALQSGGSLTATRPWAVIGSLTAQPTSSDSVPVTADVTHTGKMVRGQTTITSTSADFENRGNFANGGGHHVFTGLNAFATGDQNTVYQFGLAAGQQNTVSGNSSAALGIQHTVAGDYAVAGGANHNIDAASTCGIAAGGHNHHLVSSPYSGMLAGDGNYITNTSYAGIVAGTANQIYGSSTYSVIAGGVQNQIYSGAVGSFVGAGKNNYSRAVYGGIVCGENNQVYHSYAAILTGYNNYVTGNNSAVLAGSTNQITTNVTESSNSLIGTGLNNKIIDSGNAAVLTGQDNTLNTSSYCGILTGYVNSMLNSGYSGIVAGGSNQINGAAQSFIGAGIRNTITGATHAAIVAGSDNTVTGGYSTVINGNTNVINGVNSVAGGTDCKVTHNYAFMWNSADTAVIGNTTFNSAAAGEFAVTAHGGVRFFSNQGRTTGMTMAAGTSSWTAVSSAAVKGDFKAVPQDQILAKLLSVPIQTYKYKKEDGTLFDTINIGPTAEDWDQVFAELLGKKSIAIDEQTALPAISEGDKLGVALAAIQALTLQLYELKAMLSQ